MKWFLAAVLMLTLLTLMVSNHNIVVTSGVETVFSSHFSGCCGAIMDRTLSNSTGIYLVADDGNGDENGEKKEKDLEADPAGGVDRIWNSVQLA